HPKSNRDGSADVCSSDLKQLFGGLGQNFMNPALAARCFLLISFTGRMTSFTYDGVTGAPPLATMRADGSIANVDTMKMFIGQIPDRKSVVSRRVASSESS